MTIPQTIGFPRMREEQGEKRVFLPRFIQFLAKRGATVYLEEGYGARSGYTFRDYQKGLDNVHTASRSDILQKDIVIVLRSPTMAEFDQIRPGSILISMLHYPTRPLRVQRLRERGIRAISLDSIVSDSNIRLVENMKAVAWNGLETAFCLLEERWPGLHRLDGKPLRALILGAGMVGKHAVEAATKLGSPERNQQHISEGGLGIIVMTVGRNLTYRSQQMEALLRQTDVLVDATQRRNAAQPVILNVWLDWLPDHAVITDLAVDPYTLNADPPVVRGIEGIPQGNLNKYVFLPTDPDWGKTVPAAIPSAVRRTVVSCYSWPGIYPEACMRHYGEQLRPLLRRLLQVGYDALSLKGDFFERALYRASLKAWLTQTHNAAAG